MPRITRAITWTFAISVGLVAAILVGCGDAPPEVARAEPAPEPARTGSPLSGGLQAPRSASFVGIVETRLAAGSYTYLAVRDDADLRWVATTGHGVPAGSVVAVKSWGVRTDFYSRRLERSFPELEFGSVEPVAREGTN